MIVEPSIPSSLVRFVDAIPLAVMVHTMDFRVVAANRLCEELLGCTVQNMIGRLVADFVPVDDRASARDMAVQLTRDYPLDGSGPGTPIGSLRRIRRQDGSVLSCWMQVGLADLDGQRVIVACMDLVDRADDNSVRWRERAERDDLTGLLRRRPFLDRVEEWVHRDAPLALAFVDVDRLKTINDTYGHSAGDQVLESAARRLDAWAPPNAVVGRFAGDEFVVAVSDETVSAQSLTAEIRRAVCREPVPWTSELLMLSVSIGAVVRTPDEDGLTLLGRADALMYRDKAGRRPSV